MFSKFGKESGERFLILKKKDEILSGKSRKIKVKRIDLKIRKKKLSADQVDKLLETPYEQPHPKKAKTQLSNSAAFKAQSRDQYYKSTTRESCAPPSGYYSAKYHHVKKNVRKPDFSQRPATASRATKQSHLNQEITSPEKLKLHVPTTMFVKQSGRQSMVSPPRDVNEKRFEKVEVPLCYSGNKRVRTPDISKTTPRNFSMAGIAGPSYCPNYNLVSKDLGKVCLFDKYLPRQPNECPINDTDYKINYKHTEKKVSVHEFGKSHSRPCSTSSLPIYMQRVYSMCNSKMLTEKMLSMNNSIGSDIHCSRRTASQNFDTLRIT